MGVLQMDVSQPLFKLILTEAQTRYHHEFNIEQCRQPSIKLGGSLHSAYMFRLVEFLVCAVRFDECIDNLQKQNNPNNIAKQKQCNIK